MKSAFRYIIFIVSILFTFNSCKQKGCMDLNASNYDSNAKKDDGSCIIKEIDDEDESITPINSSSNVLGYSILAKLPGIWDGPVVSPTPIGNFPAWIVDFRPISASQVSAKNELDSINDIFMSFFIVKHNNEYKIAFRNGGGFAGSVRNSYQVLESITDTLSEIKYRFVDAVAGESRVCSDVTFKQDSLIIHVFTNQFNTLPTAVTHMKWTAKLKDLTSTQDAINLFDYPKKELTKDFSTTFEGQSQAVFYSVSSDPYPESEQPYLGVSTININVTNPSTINSSNKILISITTQPLFNNFTYLTANLKYRSRYVLVDAATNTSFNFNYMHPGTYYVNAIYDSNGDSNFSSGDYINSSTDVPLTLTNKGTTSANLTIDFLIP